MAQAQALAREGNRVLLAEMGQGDYLARLLGWERIPYEPRHSPFQPNLHICAWTGDACLKEYLLMKLKLTSLYKAIFENRFAKAFLDVAPGLWELAVLGKFTSGIRGVAADLPYDYIILDAYSTGQATNLLRVPLAMTEFVRGGAMYDQSQAIHRALTDRSHCRFLIVTLPEVTPLRETKDFIESLQSVEITQPYLAVNRLFQPPGTDQDLKVAAREWTDEKRAAVEYLQQVMEFQRRALNTNSVTLAESTRHLPELFCLQPDLLARQLSHYLMGWVKWT